MSWLSKQLKKIKIKDIVGGVSSVVKVLPGGTLIAEGLKQAEKAVKVISGSDKKKEAAKTSGVQVAAEDLQKMSSASTSTSKNNLILLGIAGLALYFLVLKK